MIPLLIYRLIWFVPFPPSFPAIPAAVLYSLERFLAGAGALLCGLYIAATDWPTLALGVALRLPFALQFVERSVQIGAGE